MHNVGCGLWGLGRLVVGVSIVISIARFIASLPSIAVGRPEIARAILSHCSPSILQHWQSRTRRYSLAVIRSWLTRRLLALK